jgi:GT2 family glycosyltransferase
MAEAPLILLVGMHRSGTSLLGSMLPKLGVPLPGPLIAGDQHNPEGYYERNDVTALQEQLLIDLGHWWPSQEGVLPLPIDWQQRPATLRCKQALRQLLLAEQQRQQSAWAIKDPRTSLLLPLWLELSAELNIPLKLVLGLRDPREVLVSLVQRDQQAAGMTAWRAQQLWWRHNLQVLSDATEAALPLLVMDYQRWFSRSAAQQVEQLARFCRNQPPDADAMAAALACIRPEHRRSAQWRKRLRHPLLHPRLARLQGQLQRLGHQHHMPAALHSWLQRQTLPLSLPLAKQRGRQWPLPLAMLSNAAEPPPLPDAQLLLLGSSWRNWQPHAWLQHIPLPAGMPLAQLQLHEQTSAAAAILNLAPIPANQQCLALLQRSPVVYDPDPERCRHLQYLGVAAHWLQQRHPSTNSWLSGMDLAAAVQELGLPPTAAAPAQSLICLGSGGTAWDQQLKTDLWCLPGFDQLQISNPHQAQLLAAWLNQAQRHGHTLIRLQPTALEEQQRGFAALSHPDKPATTWLPTQQVYGDISPQELRSELAWLRAGAPAPPACSTPMPATALIWQHCNGSQATAAVCISLYNYADRIATALESVWAQRHQALELIVVDDGSNDGGLQQVERWLQQRGSRFCRAQLLRHESNSGLAAARNTAFAAAEAPWCFVLDADNQMHPDALEHCLAIAHACPSSTAVVHPLVVIESHGTAAMAGRFLSSLSWQRQQFLSGNIIDAMALVRRDAWQAVQGYTHIPGGWEDFDFWCKLIEAGWHGVLCPQPLATYVVHGESMLQACTNLQKRQLKRILQARHPWLALT